MKKKILILIVFILLLLLNSNKIYNTISKSTNNKNFETNLSEDRIKNYNKMKIDSVNVISRNTGTEPFNNDSESNEYGIDVSESDDYVRTFDYVKYVLELGIVPNTFEIGVTDSSTFSGGVVKVKAKLPNQGDRILMTWEEDAWMKNVSYNEDKTEIYAEYYISKDTNIAYANQSLSFTFKINGYKEEITRDMAPEFEVWMEGNSPDNDKSGIESVKFKDTNNKLIISGKPSYDVDLKASTYLYPGKKDDISGEYVSYGVGIALIQPYSYISDLRGVEYPTGKFEIELDNIYSARKINVENKFVDVSNKVNTTLEAYSVNGVDNDNYYPTKNVYTRKLPKGIGGGYKGVTDSGDMSTTFKSNITTISFENYKLNNKYPVRNVISANSDILYPNNLGYIMVGNVQLFVPFYDNESTYSYDYSYDTKVNKIKYYDSKGNLYEINGNDEFNADNNNISASFKKNNNGDFYVSSNIKSNNTESTDGLASASLGTYIEPSFTLLPVTGPYDSAERLIVWNSNYFELVKRNNSDWITIGCGSELGFACNGNKNFDIKYGIYKKNKDGIDSDDTVNNVYFDDFTWYDTIEEAMNNGNVSAIYGLDKEVLGNRVYRNMYTKFKIKEDASLIGSVGMIVHRTKIYDIDKTITYEPYKNNKYIKTAYDNEGNVIKSHSTFHNGLSVLILGTKAGITTTVTDVDDKGNLKTNYDTTDKEINIKLIPTLNDSNSNSENNIAELVTVKSILPIGLNYKEGSSNKEPSEIINNIDGTTTLVWKYNNWIINSDAPEYPEITYKADISSSIDNNKSLNINSSIYEEHDLRDIRYRNNDYTIMISNLSGSKTLKDIDKKTLDVNESFNITNTIGNINRTELSNVKGFEILPKDTFNGTYKIKVTKLDSKQKLYYTEKNLDELNIEEDINGRKIINDFDESLWNEVNENDYIPESATAILTIIDKLDNSNSIKFEYNIIPADNKIGDKYSFTMNIISSNLSTSVKSNTVISEVVERKISGIAFVDNNGNNKYDNLDKLLENVNVNLLNEEGNVIKSTKTDNNGSYFFDGLSKGNYYVSFDIPDGYKTISVDDNKANTDGTTDIIKHNIDKNISNINLGIEKKKVSVITHHYYEGTNKSISDDVIKKYLFGDNYDTKLSDNIPVNYELVDTPSNKEGVADKDNIEVIYYYKIKDSIVEDTISKTGTDVISNKKDTVKYKINYNVKVSDYIGSSNIVIKDTLPFDIDLDKSNLDGGTYNNEDRTITWKINKDINTFKKKFNLNIEKNIEVVYKDMNLLNNMISNNAIGTITLSNNKSEKKTSFDTTIKIPSTIVEYYYKKDTTIELKPSFKSTGFVGQKYVPNIENINGYELVEEENNNYIYDDEEQIIIHEYVKIEENPKTLDNIYKYFIIFISSIIFITGLLMINKRQRNTR